jgi:hypothetical protein
MKHGGTGVPLQKVDPARILKRMNLVNRHRESSRLPVAPFIKSTERRRHPKKVVRFALSTWSQCRSGNWSTGRRVAETALLTKISSRPHAFLISSNSFPILRLGKIGL